MKASIPVLLKIPLLLGLAGLTLGIVRFAMQGTATLYTSFARTFYVDDPKLGWVSTDEAWAWLGGDVLIIIGVILVGTFAMHKLSRRDGKLASTAGWLAKLGAVACVATPIIPLYALAGGMPPTGAQLLLPSTPSQATQDRATLDVQEGRWEAVSGAKHLVVASIAAGKETFDGRFSDIQGYALVAGDPSKTTVEMSVDAGSIKTGIELRDEHAAADFKPKEHPRVRVSIAGFDTLTADGAFESTATLTMAGKPVKVPVKGTLRVVDGQLIVDGSMNVDLNATHLDVSAFDKPTIGVTIRVILAPAK